jgi:hypothetical protein
MSALPRKRPACGEAENDAMSQYLTFRSELLHVRRWLNQKRLCVDLVHEDERNSTRCFLSYGTGNACAPVSPSALLQSVFTRTYGGCDHATGQASFEAETHNQSRRREGARCRRTGVFRWRVVHPHPRCPLLVSRNLTIPRQMSASFLAKRKWPTSVSPRSISSIEKTLAAACS